MKYLIALLLLFGSIFSFAQTTVNPQLSEKDSILLSNFWTTLKEGIANKDKEKLSSICKFPFICSQCLDDTMIKHKDPNYVKATKKIFYESAYQIFFEKIFLDFVNKKNMPRDLYIFGIALNDKGRKIGYRFNYLVSRKPGRQIWVYLRKDNGIYKISATESLP